MSQLTHPAGASQDLLTRSPLPRSPSHETPRALPVSPRRLNPPSPPSHTAGPLFSPSISPRPFPTLSPRSSLLPFPTVSSPLSILQYGLNMQGRTSSPRPAFTSFPDDALRASLIGLGRDGGFLVSPPNSKSAPTAIPIQVPSLVFQHPDATLPRSHHTSRIASPAIHVSREHTASPGGTKLDRAQRPAPLDLSKPGAAGRGAAQGAMRIPYAGRPAADLRYFTSAASSLPSPVDSAFGPSPPVTSTSAVFPNGVSLSSSPLATHRPTGPNDVDAELASALAVMVSHSPANPHAQPHAFNLGQFDSSPDLSQLPVPAYFTPAEALAFHSGSGTESHSPASYTSNSPFPQTASEQEVDYLALMYPSPPPTAGTFGHPPHGPPHQHGAHLHPGHAGAGGIDMQYIAPQWTVSSQMQMHAQEFEGEAQTDDEYAMHQHQAYLDPTAMAFYHSNAFGITVPTGPGTGPPPFVPQPHHPSTYQPRGPSSRSPSKTKRRLASSAKHPSGAVTDSAGNPPKSPRRVRSRKFSKVGGGPTPSTAPSLPPVPRLPSRYRPHPHPSSNPDLDPLDADGDDDMSDGDEDMDNASSGSSSSEQHARDMAALSNIDLTEKFEEVFSGPPGGMSTTRRFKCLMCGKLFPRKSAIFSHVQMHLGIRPFACHWAGCRMKFVRNHDLGRHIKSKHTHQKDHRCPCGSSFSRPDALTRHRSRNICCGGIKS